MSKAFIITEAEDSISIEILSQKRSIVKTILLLKAIGFSFTSFFLAIYISSHLFEKPILTVVILVICGLLFLAGYNFFKKFSHVEVIEIDDEYFSIINKYLFFSKKKMIHKNEIDRIKCVEKPDYTRHPMDSNTIDYTGLATAEKEVQYLAEYGTLELHSKGEKFLFGENLPSWDAEKLIEIIEEFLKR